MYKCNAGIGVLLGGVLVLTMSAQTATTTPENPSVIVGTFDSRAIAVAYAQSDEFKDYIVAQQADIGRAIERAEAAGDEDLVAELNALGPAMQARLHGQGFSTAPVDDIIARLEPELPAIAAAAGVDVIVSKWTLTYSGPAAKFVDVTNRIAAEFDPTERTLKMIESLVETDPVPLEELDNDH